MHQHHKAGRRELTVSTPGVRANPEPPDGGEEGVEPPHQGRQEWLTAAAQMGGNRGEGVREEVTISFAFGTG